MPSPLDRPPISGVDFLDQEKEIVRPSSDTEPFSALAFKIMNDPFVGSLTFTRIYSGILDSGSSVKNPVKGKTERIGRMLQMHANERTEVKRARAGDIVAIVGLKDTTTGDTLCDPANACILERMDFPAPVIKVSHTYMLNILSMCLCVCVFIVHRLVYLSVCLRAQLTLTHSNQSILELINPCITINTYTHTYMHIHTHTRLLWSPRRKPTRRRWVSP